MPAQLACPPGGAHADRPVTRVLVIDDDASTAELLRVVLEDADHHVTLALSDTDLPAGPFDCVVADLMARSGYTYEAAQLWLRRLAERFPGTPVVLVTAHPGATADRARLQARAVIMKPFDVDQLVAAVRAVTS